MMRAFLLTLLASCFAFAQNPQPSNTFKFGQSSVGDKKIIFNRGQANNPTIRWSESNSGMQFSNDGVLFSDLPTGTTTEKNFLINSAMNLWQRGTSIVVTDGNFSYEADRWYVVNGLGTDGEITYSRVTGVTAGSKYGLRVQISQAPTASTNNVTELYQTLENQDSLLLYNKIASFGVLIKAQGLVNQVGIQFMYATTETKVDTTIGSEVLCTVNTSTFTSCAINGQAMGTSQTTSGVVGVRVRITGVSSGNLYDLNNGYVVEQAMLNKGSQVATWQPAGKTYAAELLMAERYYYKTYPSDVAPGSITNNGAALSGVFITGGGSVNINHPLPAELLSGVTLTVYNPVTGSVGDCRDQGGADATFVTSGYTGQKTISVDSSSGISNGRRFACHFTIESEI